MSGPRPLRPHDPGGLALRAALRVAVITPSVFAIGLAFDEQTGLFAIFGSLALLVFADFGGPRNVRAGAYALLTLAGCVLIPLGTLCSQTPGLAAAAMFVVGLAILFAGVFNGYLATAASAALLSFILPTMVAADAGAIPERLAGWLLAAAVSIPAVLLVFPQHRRDALRDAIAQAARAVADLVAEPGAARMAAAEEAAAQLRARFAATPYRPTGPTGSTGALAELVDELDWLRELCRPMTDDVADVVDPTEAERALRAETATILRASAALVDDPSAPLPDTERLEAIRVRVSEEVLDALAALAAADAPDATLWSRVRHAWEVRAVSYGVLDVAQKARTATGNEEGATGPRWRRFVARQRIALAATRRVAAAHAGVRSVWFRNSVRAAVGLALAVLLAQEASVQHGFWVVLGVLSVLRSNAVGTARTIVQAFTGTLAGIVVAGLVLLAIGDATTVLWALLPFACFGAGYAPKAISFAAGQACFSIAVLIAFNLIAPTGWEVGLVRIEDVSIGFAIGLGAGLLLWPRGAAALLRRSLGAALEADSRLAALAAERLFGADVGDRIPAAEVASAAADGRLDVAVRQRLAERGPHSTEQLVDGMRLVAGAARVRRSGTVLVRLHELTPDVPRPAGLEPLVDWAERLADWYGTLGRRLAERAGPPEPVAFDERRLHALIEGLRAGVSSPDRDRGRAALSCAWTGLHVGMLRRMETRMAEAAARLVER